MRTREKSRYRISVAFTLTEIQRLTDIVAWMAEMPDDDRPATVSEAVRWAVFELHTQLAALRQGIAQTEIVNVEETRPDGGRPADQNEADDG